jgi:hypothetical protein
VSAVGDAEPLLLDADGVPPLAARLRPLVVVGLGVGLARYALEFVAPDVDLSSVLYHVMLAVFVVIGWRRAWGRIRWRAMFGTVALACIIVWGVTYTLTYTTAQFLGWTHGRFHYFDTGDPTNRAAPIAATRLGKIGVGLLLGQLGILVSTVWCTILGTLVIWLPARLRRG